MSQQDVENKANVTTQPEGPASTGENATAESESRSLVVVGQDELEAANGSSAGEDGQTEEELGETEDTTFEDFGQFRAGVNLVFDFLGKQYSGSISSTFSVTLSDKHESLQKPVFEVNQVRLASGEHTVVGTPYIADACVWVAPMHLTVKKIHSFKKRRRKHSSATLRGQRQVTIRYQIMDMHVPGLIHGPEIDVEAISKMW